MKINIDNLSIKLSVFKNKLVNIKELLEFCTENSCSDLFIKVNEQPYLNRYGKIFIIPSLPINNIIWNNFAVDAITSENNAKYVREKMLDMAYEIPISPDNKYCGSSKTFRYRVSLGFSQGQNIATFRIITPILPSFASINFPEDVKSILKKGFEDKNGIVMFCGATGSGKTTSMSACLNDFTQYNEVLDNNMIITLEDPIEYIYNSSSSVRLIQKELGKDFKSYPSGVKQALREHPTLIVCAELRDKEGISTCVEASRTGHKVVTTFHTENVAGSISRMYNYISGDNVDIMYDLISNISLMICQRLSSSDNAFILETQYMIFTEEIKNVLIKSISNNKNITIVINELFKDQDLLRNGIIKDWS